MMGYVFNDETLVSGSVFFIAISLVFFAFIEFSRLLLLYSKTITKKDPVDLMSAVASGLAIFLIANETLAITGSFIKFGSYSIFLYVLAFVPWVLFMCLRTQGCSYNDAGFSRDAVSIALIVITAFMPIYVVSNMIIDSSDQVIGHFHHGTIQKIERNSSTNETDIYFTKKNDNTVYFVKVNKTLEDYQSTKKNVEISFLCHNSKQDPVVKASDKDSAPVCHTNKWIEIDHKHLSEPQDVLP